MAIDTKLRYASVDDLYLDPLNPRLGRGNTGPKVRQEVILDLMQDWSLEELAISFLESGFWPQEALLVVQEAYLGKPRLIVIEGNRRLAALKYLQAAVTGQTRSRKWLDLIEEKAPAPKLLTQIPYILVDSRKDVSAFLGFRHVTGIKEWRPAEKAEYIAKLIDDDGLSYVDVMRKIGSKTNTVRQNYISYKLLLQMDEHQDISIEHVEDRFSVLFLSIRTEGAKKYLHLNIGADPTEAREPVPKDHLDNLGKFALWLFGSKDRPPVVKDSRQIDQFGQILESKKAVEYLERSDRPSFEIAYQMAGGDEPEIIRLIEQAADNVEVALGKAHRYTKSKKVRAATSRLGEDTAQLVSLFFGLHEELQAKK